MIKAIYKYFSNPLRLSILNGMLILVAIALNRYFQIFCIPSNWMIILLTICIIATIIYPFSDQSKFAPFTSFIHGISLFILIYCVLFLEEMNLVGLIAIIIGIGIPILIPYFLIVQLVWRNLFRPPSNKARYFFLAAICICMGSAFYIGHEYKQAMGSIEKFKNSHFTQLDKNSMTEKILGMHFIYHTRYCISDGWRPPKHDPLLVIGMWLNNRRDPLNVDLETRLKLYKKFFPDRKYKFDCSCAIQYSKNYHNDYLWK